MKSLLNRQSWNFIQRNQRKQSIISILSYTMSTSSAVDTTKTDSHPVASIPSANQVNDGITKVSKFKLCVTNLPKYSKKADLEKILQTHNVVYNSCKKVPNSHGFIGFDSKESMEAAQELLAEKESSLEIKLAINNKRKLPQLMANRAAAKAKVEATLIFPTIQNPTCIQDVTTSLWRIPYEEQKELKLKQTCKSLRNVKRKMLKKELKKGYKYEDLPVYIRSKDDRFDNKKGADKTDDGVDWELSGTLCPVEPVRSAEPINEYRNKCEFTISGEIGSAVVGFRMGLFGEGKQRIVPPQGCVQVPKPVVALCERLMRFLNTVSKQQPYRFAESAGFWRMMTVKYSRRCNEMMAMVRIKNDGDVDEAAFNTEMQALVTHLCGSAEEPVLFEGQRLTCLYVENYIGLSQPMPGHPNHLLFGVPAFHDSILGLKFKIAPGSFFQCNTPCADVLFDTVKEVLQADASSHAAAATSSSSSNDDRSELTGDGERAVKEELAARSSAKKPILLDICCGIGTIGLLLADQVQHVIGIELVPEAIEDAKHNAALNEVDNCSFLACKAEHVLGHMLQHRKDAEALHFPPKAAEQLRAISEENLTQAVAAMTLLRDLVLQGHEVIAVVNPPRKGLHMDVLKALKKCKYISRLVYVSCDPFRTFCDDTKTLCELPTDSASQRKLLPYEPIKAIPVDMYPHTEHCEIVAVFKRGSAAIPFKPTEAQRKNNQRNLHKRRRR